MSRKNRSPKENARRAKIRELLQMANIDSIALLTKMIMNLCKQDRLDAWGSLRVAFTYHD